MDNQNISLIQKWGLFIASQPTTPEDVLKKLVDHESSEVRNLVYNHLNATDEIKQLVKDNDKKYTVSVK
jgi:hypothetical protein